jgi:hypothetical protein
MGVGVLSSRVLSLGLALWLGASSTLAAQGNRRTQLDVTGFPLTVTSTSANDFDAGSVALGSIGFQVDLTTNSGGGGFSPRGTSVAIRCAPACPASGSLASGGLQWRRADLAAWNTLTTTFQEIEYRVAAFNGANDPWSNSVFFRYLLTWTGNPPTAATQFRIQLQLTVTAP